MSTEFRSRLQALAQRSVTASARCANEESAKLFLVMPFISLLGYDPTNPHEVYPEHHADFSEKYKNRVDFAILKDDLPIIAIECKGVGQSTKDDRGQLKSYFNAASSAKMAILTDGIVWEFYADTEEPNLMDDKAFLMVDLREAARGKIDDSALDALSALHKDKFDPENIGAKAREKHVFNSVLKQIAQFSREPSEHLCRLLLQNAGVTHVRQKVLEDYRKLVASAFKEFINQEILSRLDISEKSNIVTPTITEEVKAIITSDIKQDPKIMTTEVEMSVFHWVQKRLAFLTKDDNLFREIDRISYKDYQGKFAVFYKMERKGRLFDYIEGKIDQKGQRHRFVFPEDVKVSAREITTDRLQDIDKDLLSAFQTRVLSLQKAEPSE